MPLRASQVRAALTRPGTPLAANNHLFQIQLHQMLEIIIELFFRKTGEKFRLGTSVDFADVVNQLPFTHTNTPFKTLNSLATYGISTEQTFFL
jgi:hypothetical protein